MRTHTVIDGNAFYEIDEECCEQMKKEETKRNAAGRGGGGIGKAAAGQKETGESSRMLRSGGK